MMIFILIKGVVYKPYYFKVIFVNSKVKQFVNGRQIINLAFLIILIFYFNIYT